MIPSSPFSRYDLLVIALFIALLAVSVQASAQQDLLIIEEPAAPLWEFVSTANIAKRGPRHEALITDYHSAALNQKQLNQALSKAPQEFTKEVEDNPATIVLPLPDGTLTTFTLVESSVMEATLAARFPTIKTYAGHSIDNPAIRMRLDYSPSGLNAIILAPEKTYFIQPYQVGDSEHHIIYDHDDLIQQPFNEGKLEESPELKEFLKQRSEKTSRPAPYSVGDKIRLYRMAVSATGEFSTSQGGGTTAGTLAAIVTRINQLNAAFERDVAVRFVLINETTNVIYLNAATDPFTDTNKNTMLDENQTTLNNVIGEDKFDIGHVFASQANGGVASLGAVCGTTKARGVTSGGAPFGVLAHEVGHQLAAGHVQNTSVSNCNRASASAWEPGSGVTIMSYNGICDSLGSSTDNFNVGSFQQMRAYIDDGNGATCGVDVNLANSAPVVNAGSTGFSIPINTPYTLVGSATDAEGGVLTYSWEQHDLGAAALPGVQPAGETVPLVRVDPPKDTGVRNIPRTEVVAAGLPDATNAELLPSFARSLTFRLQVRDNHPGVGGVAYAETTFNAVDTGATFQVTSPNTGGENWTTGGSETVTWNVANTDQAPISCSQVNIDLSTDGGQTYPHNLATNTPNDGSHNITVPNIPTSLFARVRVACSQLPDHFFYDISDNSFTSGTINTTCASNVVTNISDSGACTLRQHVADATAGDTITFDASIAGQTIHLLTEIGISKNLTIDGTGKNITISGDGDNNGVGDSRIFDQTAGNFVLRELTLTKGRVTASGDNNGGLIYINNWGSTLSIYDSTLSDGYAEQIGGAIYARIGTTTLYNTLVLNNEAGGGGGVAVAFTTFTAYNSTFSGNTARWWTGGAVYGTNWTTPMSTVTLHNSTLYNNSAAQTGGGVHIDDNATLNMTNTLIGGSTNGGDCFINTAIATNVNNWIQDGSCSPANSGDPMLGPLGRNGGATQTFPLQASAGPIDNGNAAGCANANLSGKDQRGYSHNGTCDIGAFEYNGTEAHAGNDAPTIGNQTLAVNEASAPGAVVGTVTATDSNNLTFAIIGGNTNNAFNLNSSTGQLTVQSNSGLTGGAVFNLNVRVLDDGAPNLASFAVVTVNVTDINQAPAVDNQTFTASQTATVGSLVGAVLASDADNDNLTFAITAGNTGGAFNINPTSGDLTVANTTALSNAPFNLTVQVIDDGSPNQNDTATVTVNTSACPTLGVVTSTSDSGPCTLRQNVADASAGDTLTFDPSIAGQTIRLATEIAISKDITIDGTGKNITISGDTDNDGTGDTRIFTMSSGHLTLRKLTVTKGRVPNVGNNGGLIYVSHFDTLSIYDSTLSDGYAYQYGGAIYSVQGEVNLYNSLVVNNEAGSGGGIAIAFETLNVYNSTISGNTARWWDGGGIVTFNWGSGETITMVNSSVLNNQAPSVNGGGMHAAANTTVNLTNTLIGGSTGGSDCVSDAGLATNVSNWVQDGSCSAGSSGDPMVAPLADNGGPTQTHALQAGSGAINIGNAAACAAVGIDGLDQRDHLRNDTQCDIGAFEYGAASATAVWDGGGSTNNWSEAANWVGDTIPIAVNNVIFNGTSSKNATIDASFAGTIKSITLADGYTGEVTLARSLTVTGAVSVADDATLNLAGQTLTTEAIVTNKGIIKDTRGATTVSTTVAFGTIKNAAGTVIQYYGIDITPTGGSMGNVTVAIDGNQNRCTLNGSDPILTRCFDITPDTQTAATIRYYFEEAERNNQFANTLKIWHYNGSSWDAAGSNNSYSETDLLCINNNRRGCWVQVDNITSYSPFVIGGEMPPTTSVMNISKPTLSIGYNLSTLTISWGTEANSCDQTNVFTATGSPYMGFSQTATGVNNNSWDASGTETSVAVNTYYYIQEIHCATGAIFTTNAVGEFTFDIEPGS